MATSTPCIPTIHQILSTTVGALAEVSPTIPTAIFAALALVTTTPTTPTLTTTPPPP